MRRRSRTRNQQSQSNAPSIIVARDVPGVGGGDGVAGDLVDVADKEGTIVGEVEVDLAVGRALGRELGFDLEEVLFIGEFVLLAVLRSELAPPDVGVVVAGLAFPRAPSVGEENGEVGVHGVHGRVGGVPDGDEVALGRYLVAHVSISHRVSITRKAT